MAVCGGDCSIVNKKEKLVAKGGKDIFDKEIELSEGAMEKLRENFSMAMKFNDFGNGRYVRNIIERAMMAQANRLMKKDVNAVSDRDIVTICAEDIEIFSQSKVETRRIGFA